MAITEAIAFVGAGQITEAMVRGIIGNGYLKPELVHVCDPVNARLEHMHAEYGVIVHDKNIAALMLARTIVLAVKPQLIAAVLKDMAPQLAEHHRLVSVAAGTTIESIERAVGKPMAVMRAMPNLAASVQESATVLARGEAASDHDMQLASELFKQIGRVWELPEKLFDAVTALSGSGPAYVLTFIEALTDGGVRIGLPRDVAEALALQTVGGTTTLLEQSGEHPAKLRGQVTSPGGTTIAGLHALEQEGFRNAIYAALVAAAERAKEIAKG